MQRLRLSGWCAHACVSIAAWHTDEESVPSRVLVPVSKKSTKAILGYSLCTLLLVLVPNPWLLFSPHASASAGAYPLVAIPLHASAIADA